MDTCYIESANRVLGPRFFYSFFYCNKKSFIFLRVHGAKIVARIMSIVSLTRRAC